MPVQKRLIAFLLLAGLLGTTPVSAFVASCDIEIPPGWTWRDGTGKVRTLEELSVMISAHKLWLSTRGEQGDRLDLHDADLKGYVLHGEDLRLAHLRGAKFNSSRFFDVNFKAADLYGSTFADGCLISVYFEATELRDVDFGNTEMRGLRFRDATFEPAKIPNANQMANSEGLETLRYDDNPLPMVSLRKAFQEGGFREEERRVTYALKRRETEISGNKCHTYFSADPEAREIAPSYGSLGACGDYVFNKAMFEWTCDYGMTPSRPLWIITIMWAGLSMVYFVFLHLKGDSGLILLQEGKAPIPIGLDIGSEPHRRGRKIKWRIAQECALVRTSMFFSMMSAFNIGFREINFGRWLRLLTRTEFDLKPIGWIRVISGWQALISVYMLALWVLTYFGRPFQ